MLGAELEARNHGMYLLLSSVAVNLTLPEDVPRFLRGRDVDGVIIAGSVSDELIQYISAENIPMVLIDYRVPDLKIDAVVMDNRNGVQQAVEHLHRQGYRHIGFLGGSYYHISIKEREEGYRLALERIGLSEVARNHNYTHLKTEETTANIGAEGIRKILEQVPKLDAVICVNDTTAIGALNELYTIGRKVPEEIGVVGFDDINSAAVTHPSLTTLHVPKIEMGVEAMKLLVDRIENPKKLFHTRLVPVEIVVRESSLRHND